MKSAGGRRVKKKPSANPVAGCPGREATTKSERSREDAAAPMGVATTDSDLRVLAAVGKIDEVPSEFLPCDDVSFGGVLLALPALLSSGLLRHCKRFFSLPPGYYGVGHLFTILAFMALCRIKSIEALGSSAPGEWGKLLGLDRCPATKTLRQKIKLLAADGADEWAAQLCDDWMQADPANAGILYIDGHTRVYHGSQTKLPRHHVARQRLCMRATADYWVNGFDGLPFFKVNWKGTSPIILVFFTHGILEGFLRTREKGSHNLVIMRRIGLNQRRDGFVNTRSGHKNFGDKRKNNRLRDPFSRGSMLAERRGATT